MRSCPAEAYKLDAVDYLLPRLEQHLASTGAERLARTKVALVRIIAAHADHLARDARAPSSCHQLYSLTLAKPLRAIWRFHDGHVEDLAADDSWDEAFAAGLSTLYDLLRQSAEQELEQMALAFGVADPTIDPACIFRCRDCGSLEWARDVQRHSCYDTLAHQATADDLIKRYRPEHHALPSRCFELSEHTTAAARALIEHMRSPAPAPSPTIDQVELDGRYYFFAAGFLAEHFTPDAQNVLAQLYDFKDMVRPSWFGRQ